MLCATNLSAGQLRDPERFRHDLLYRINTIEIHIPPLRERPATSRCWSRISRATSRGQYARTELTIPAEAMTRLTQSTAGPAMCAN